MSDTGKVTHGNAYVSLSGESNLNDKLGGIKFCEHGNMVNDLNYCSICIELKSLNRAIIVDGEYLRKQIKEIEHKVEGLESTMLFLQSKLRQMNRPNYRVINRECLNAIKLIREGAENE